MILGEFSASLFHLYESSQTAPMNEEKWCVALFFSLGQYVLAIQHFLIRCIMHLDLTPTLTNNCSQHKLATKPWPAGLHRPWKNTQLEQLSAQPNPNMNLFHVFQMLHFYMIFDDARILELHQPFSCGLSLLGVPERNWISELYCVISELNLEKID